MKKESIRVSWAQLAFFFAVFLLPMVFSLVLLQLYEKPPKRELVSLLVIIICVGLALVSAGSILLRREIELSETVMQVKHSFYTVRIDKAEVKGVDVKLVDSVRQLNISIKKNGIAAFGLLSGWFYGPFGDLMFCAISRRPVYLFSLKGDTRCRLIALSCTRETAEAIRRWAEKTA